MYVSLCIVDKTKSISHIEFMCSCINLQSIKNTVMMVIVSKKARLSSHTYNYIYVRMAQYINNEKLITLR